MFGTPLIAFSMGEATVCSSVDADAPGYTACTVTTGGAISGYCAMGSERIAARPASTMKMEITAANSGRSMKKRENMAGPFAAASARRHRGRGPPGGWRGLRRGDLDRRAGLQARDAVDDHVVAGGEARFDDEEVSAVPVDPSSDRDRTRLGDVLAVLVLAGDID